MNVILRERPLLSTFFIICYTVNTTTLIQLIPRSLNFSANFPAWKTSSYWPGLAEILIVGSPPSLVEWWL
jgi:hypothetical protein